MSPSNEAIDAHTATAARMPLAIEVAADATGTALVVPGVGLFTYQSQAPIASAQVDIRERMRGMWSKAG